MLKLTIAGTAGLGLSTVQAISAKNPEHICFMARNATKAASIIESLKKKHAGLSISFIKCDMSTLSSVQTAAKEFVAAHTRLDVLVANAGNMLMEPTLTEDGFPVEFQTNHVGHALLIKILIPLLNKTAEAGGDVRIVNLSSRAYQQTPVGGIDFETLRTDQTKLGSFMNSINPGYAWARYGQSKLANMLYADALARKYPNITAVSVHPGFIFTQLFDGVSFLHKLPVYFLAMGNTLNEEEGAHSQLWAATTPKDKIKTRTYYEPVGKDVKRTTSYSKDQELSEKLWTWTQEALKDWE